MKSIRGMIKFIVFCFGAGFFLSALLGCGQQQPAFSETSTEADQNVSAQKGTDSSSNEVGTTTGEVTPTNPDGGNSNPDNPDNPVAPVTPVNPVAVVTPNPAPVNPVNPVNPVVVVTPTPAPVNPTPEPPVVVVTPTPGPPVVVVTPTPVPPVSDTETITVTCGSQTGTVSLATTAEGESSTSFILNGEICLSASDTQLIQPLTVLFVIDQSGSMAAGSDPVQHDGTCGRYDAAQAIINQITSEAQGQASAIMMGLVGFSSSAQVLVPLTSMPSFDATHNLKSMFCASNGDTNYQAAFDTALSALKNVTGKSVLYFISDGAPEVYATYPNDLKAEDQGIAAAQSLMAAVPSLVLDAIYLKALGVSSAPGTEDPPETILDKVTGNPNNVKVVANASQLADAIVSFDNVPQVGTVDTSSLTAKLSAGTYGTATLQFSSIVESSSQAGVYEFITKPFQFFGKDGSVVTNAIVVTGKSSDGTSPSTTVDVGYTLEN